MQVFVTLDHRFQIHLLCSRPPTSTMKKTWMPNLIRRRWGKPSTNSCSCWRGKRRRASRTWPPYCHTCPRLHKDMLAPVLHVFGRGYGGHWRLVSSQHWTKIRPICSPRLSCTCTYTRLRTTGYYPWISWVIPVYLVISLACQLDYSCPVTVLE